MGVSEKLGKECIEGGRKERGGEGRKERGRGGRKERGGEEHKSEAILTVAKYVPNSRCSCQ